MSTQSTFVTRAISLVNNYIELDKISYAVMNDADSWRIPTNIVIEHIDIRKNRESEQSLKASFAIR
ncbi:hypothetical protein BLOT_006023 [Blomia tropicalis]|nr:hypothetical protein BLOT_006023 [Blomia tropicalis]